METRSKGYSTIDKILHHISFFIKHMIPWKSLFFLSVIIGIAYIDYLAVNELIFKENDVLREAIVISLTTGIIGSLLFLLLVFTLKPSIAISPFILETESLKEKGKRAWIFKIINCNWFFNITDVKINLYEFEEVHMDAVREKKNFKKTEIEVSHSYFNYINSRIHKNWKKYAAHCVVIGTLTDLREILRGNNSLELEIIAKHELSGFSIIRKQTYYTDTNAIIEGKFVHGDNFLIL